MSQPFHHPTPVPPACSLLGHAVLGLEHWSEGRGGFKPNVEDLWALCVWLLQVYSSRTTFTDCVWVPLKSTPQQLHCDQHVHPKLWAVPAAAAKSLQSCLTLCDPIDGSPPGSTVPGILQARTLQWVAISFSNARKVKSESEVAQSCPTLSDPMDCSPLGSSIHGIFQARVLEWGAMAVSRAVTRGMTKWEERSLWGQPFPVQQPSDVHRWFLEEKSMPAVGVLPKRILHWTQMKNTRCIYIAAFMW